jgi:hypothetical protein
MPAPSLRITLYGADQGVRKREGGTNAYNGDAAQVALQVIPVVAVIGAQDLVLNATAWALKTAHHMYQRNTPHLNVKEVLHTIQNFQRRV